MRDADLEADEGQELGQGDDLRHTQTDVVQPVQVGLRGAAGVACDHVGMVGDGSETFVRQLSGLRQGAELRVGRRWILGQECIVVCRPRDPPRHSGPQFPIKAEIVAGVQHRSPADLGSLHEFGPKPSHLEDRRAGSETGGTIDGIGTFMIGHIAKIQIGMAK